MDVAAVARQFLERLGHEGGAQPVPFGDRLHHELEEAVPVGGDQRVVVFPVHLELAVRVLMVVLIGLPAEIEHVAADFRDHVIAAHQRLLVVAGLLRGIHAVGDLVALRRDQEEFGLDPGLDAQAHPGGLGQQPLEHVARRLRDRLALHVKVGGDPGDLGLPGQLRDRGGIGHCKEVGMRGRQVQPCGKAGKARAAGLHVADGRRRHQLGPLRSEEVGIGDHEIPDAAFRGPCGQIGCHRCSLSSSCLCKDQRPRL